MLFELHGLILALHHDARFLRIPGALDRARTGFDTCAGALQRAKAPARHPPPRRCNPAALNAPLRFPDPHPFRSDHGQYTPPLRDMHFVLHELLHVTEELQAAAAPRRDRRRHLNAVLEEGGKFAAEVAFPLNISGDAEGCKLDLPRTRCARPRASRRPTTSTCKAVGRAELRPGIRRPGPAHRG
jgi:hypothetical protein